MDYKAYNKMIEKSSKAFEEMGLDGTYHGRMEKRKGDNWEEMAHFVARKFANGAELHRFKNIEGQEYSGIYKDGERYAMVYRENEADMVEGYKAMYETED